VGFIVVAFCADKIALGLMWYLIVSKTFLVLVLALLGIYAWTNISFALDLWRRGSGKERAISALGVVLVAGLFSVTFSLNLVDYAKNWRMSGGDRPERATNQQPSPMPQAVEAIPTSQSQSQSVPPPTTPTPAYSAWRESTGDYVATSSASIPAFPTSLSGYRSEHGKDFWGKDFPWKGTIRVFAGNDWDSGVLYPRFPATMNGCSSGVFMIRWRSANPNVLIQSALGPYAPSLIRSNPSSISAAKSSAGFGYMRGTNCDQPMFKFDRALDGSTLVDIYYELKFWQAAP
jgi:hypothetical protein